MATPLNYRRPGSLPDPDPGVDVREPVARAVVPGHLSAVATATPDAAAITAIEAAYTAAGIEYFRDTEPPPAVPRKTSLHVRPEDLTAAQSLAAETFARRAKFKAMPRPKIPEGNTLTQEVTKSLGLL